MELLEAYDLTGLFRQAAALVGCDHKTVAHSVRGAGCDGWRTAGARHRRPVPDPFAAQVEELVDRSRAQIRGIRHANLPAMGYAGFGANDPAGGRAGQAPLAAEARAADQAVGPRARVVDAVGLWRGADHRWRQDRVVLRVACLVQVPGRGAVAREDAGRGDRAGPDAAPHRRGPDLCVDG